MLVFFANWQTQACRLLFDSSDAVQKTDVAAYLYAMHDEIIAQGFYAAVEESPRRQVSVEVASALEGLADAFAIARAANDGRAERYRRCLCTGLAYLLNLQCTADEKPPERGGFGLSLGNRAQRIDVTGHVASAFMKCADGRVECALDAP
jgi:hypothetical protein